LNLRTTPRTFKGDSISPVTTLAQARRVQKERQDPMVADEN